MQNITKRRSKSGGFIRSYENMRGINLVPGSESTNSFCYLENMYVDYESGGWAVESIPGFRRLYSFGDAIHLICSVGEYILVHAGDRLYKIKKEERDNIPALCPIASLGDCKSYAYTLGEELFITDNKQIIRLSKDAEISVLNTPDEIAECAISTVHDGKLLLTGSKKKPGTIFCLEIKEEDNAISVEQQFKIPENALALASAYGYLWIFTANAVLGYKKVNGEFCEEIRLGGIRPTAEVCLFNDDLIFLTKNGLYSVLPSEKISLVRRSVAINPMLLNEDLSSARLCVWRGYLAVSIGGRMYLADSRDMLKTEECNEYRWYFLNGIGTYRGDKRVYRYSEFAPEGFSVYDHPGTKADGEIMSVLNENHEKLYFVTSGKKKYSVYPTEEMRGGLFFPAICTCESDDLLFFGTECGDLCLFNTDMRGKPPKRLSNMSGFNKEDYESATKGRIHPDFYSFDCHAPRYAVLTPKDRCGLPFERKSDVPPSLALTLKSFPGCSVIVETRYDGGAFGGAKRISNSSFDFYNLDFESHSSSSEELSIVNIPQRRVGWTEKQISIYSNEFCSPFGIYSICFAYKTPKSKNSKKGT